MPIEPGDRGFVRRTLRDRWRSERMIAHGEVYFPADLPGLMALLDGEPAGLLAYRIDEDQCEIVWIDSLLEGRGVGSALIDSVAEAAARSGCRRLWLVTTNDNLPALGFYQRRGFRLCALRPGAVDRARALKPEISALGRGGIPIRDE